MTHTKSELEALIALAEKASPRVTVVGPEGTTKISLDFYDDARTALPQIAKQLMEAMEQLEKLHHPICCTVACKACELLAAYHAQEKPKA